MRLFDKCVSTGLLEGEDLSKIIVLSCDPISEYWSAQDKRKHTGDEFPYCNPPWGEFFIEWNMPRVFRHRDGSLQPLSPTWSQCGAMCKSAVNYDAIGRAQGIALDAAIILRPFVFQAGRILPCRSIWVMLVEVGGMFHITCSYNGNDGVGVEKPPYVLPDKGHIDYITSVIGCALTFTNCCNVKLEDVTDELQPDPKIRRRLRIPEVKRYTLNIAGHVARPSRDYNEGPQGVMPFHLCRGHFATYTADKPMFGNPKLVGRYWHPPHMKGKKDNGEIIKDYAIKDTAPPGEQQCDAQQTCLQS